MEGMKVGVGGEGLRRTLTDYPPRMANTSTDNKHHLHVYHLLLNTYTSDGQCTAVDTKEGQIIDEP